MRELFVDFIRVNTQGLLVPTPEVLGTNWYFLQNNTWHAHYGMGMEWACIIMKWQTVIMIGSLLDDS